MITRMAAWEQTPELSVVLPCFDEAGNVENLVREIVAVIEPLGRSFEVIVVDDKSRDDTAAIAERLTASIPELRVVRHSINSGQSASLVTGFHHARGRLLVTLDGDGQNDPASIPDLLNALGSADCVCGVRRRRNDSFGRRLASRFGNGFRKLVTRDPTTDAGCNFRVIRADVVRELPVFNGLHRWMPALMRYQGFTVVECEVKHRARTAGVSKYRNLERGIRGLFDCIAMLWFRRRSVRARRVVVEARSTVHR